MEGDVVSTMAGTVSLSRRRKMMDVVEVGWTTNTRSRWSAMEKVELSVRSSSDMEHEHFNRRRSLQVDCHWKLDAAEVEGYTCRILNCCRSTT